MGNKHRILVVDSEATVRESMRSNLADLGFEAATAAGADQATEALRRQPFSVVISDVDLPSLDGFELLHTIREQHLDVVIILMTEYGTIESAVEAIKLGAYQYLTKPIPKGELKRVIAGALEQQALLAGPSREEELGGISGFEGVIGRDYRMAKVFDLIETVADSPVTVLLTGHSGTGKSLLARTLHANSSRRAKPFVEVSCGALSETLLESELFGHAKGAFTGAFEDRAGKFKIADGGTIFLDEIASASPAMQVKLLRVLQERCFEPVGSNATLSVDVRVVLASNVDLAAQVQAGGFRQDLYYRINVVNIELPSLADRKSDIPALARHFVYTFCARLQRPLKEIDSQAVAALRTYDWPGNVRELENAIERAVVLTRGLTIGVADLPRHIAERAQAQAQDPTPQRSLQRALEEPEKEIIVGALAEHDGNRSAAADALQINRSTLYKKMKRYGLDRVAV